MPSLVETDRISKSFGRITAVDGITLSVRQGEVLGFLGPNGAGKSTTMKMITGFLTPDSGVARVCGIDVGAEPKAAKRQLGYLPEGAPLYADMTVGAFLDFIARVRGFSAATARSRIDRAVAQTALESVVGQKIDTLSKGFRRRVGLAQAILHDPPVLILDEPTDGLDPNQKHQVRELIRGMARDKAIVVSTHILEEVEAVCTRAVVIDRGRIVADGTAEELQRRSPEHNAVSMRVAPQSLDALKAALGVQTSIIRVEEVERSAEGVRLRAYPRDGGSIAAELSAALKARDVVVSDMTVERGRLDDVFRDITSKDTTHAATARRPGAPHA